MARCATGIRLSQYPHTARIKANNVYMGHLSLTDITVDAMVGIENRRSDNDMGRQKFKNVQGLQQGSPQRRRKAGVLRAVESISEGWPGVASSTALPTVYP